MNASNKNNLIPDSQKRVLSRIFILAVCVLMITACASTATVDDKSGSASTSQSQPDDVVQRAEARWEAMLSKDLETAYTYYSPGFRSTASVVDFMFQQRDRRVKWTSAEYQDHTCAESSCKLQYKVGFKVQRAVPGMEVYEGFQTIEESWVKTQGEWWFVPTK